MPAPGLKRQGIFYGWWIVFAGFVTLAVTFGLKTYVFAVFIRPMSEDLGWSRAAASIAFTIALIFGGLISPFVGRLVDSRGPRLSVVVGALLGGAALALVGFLDQLWQWFLLFGIIYSTGETMMGAVPINTAITNWFSRKRGTAMGIVYAAISVGGLVLVPVTTLIVTRYGWRPAWIVLGALVAVTIAPVSGLIMRRCPEDMGLLPDGVTELPAQVGAPFRPDPSPLAAPDWTLAESIRTKAFWLVAIVLATGGGGGVIFSVHGFAFASDLGFSPEAVAGAISFSLVVGIPSRFLYGWLCDRMDIRYVVILYHVGLLVSYILLSQTSSLLMLYVSVLVFGCSVGGVMPVPAALAAKLFGRRSMGRIFGTLTLIGMSFVAFTAPAAGWVYDVTHSYNWAFYGMVGGLVVGIIAGQLARPPKAAPVPAARATSP